MVGHTGLDVCTVWLRMAELWVTQPSRMTGRPQENGRDKPSRYMSFSYPPTLTGTALAPGRS